MYDTIIASYVNRKTIVEPTEILNNSQISVGYAEIGSKNQVNKYYMIKEFPTFVHEEFIGLIRNSCVAKGIKINFYIYGEPYEIKWDSPEMKSKLDIWKQYTQKTLSKDVNVFDYRDKRGDINISHRIIQSTQYLNDAELNHKRSLIKASFIIKVSGKRAPQVLRNMEKSIEKLKSLCASNDIILKECKTNLVDWVSSRFPFSLSPRANIEKMITKRVMTDDILANFNIYKQGRVGESGIPLGIDVDTKDIILHEFKRDPNKLENWLIAAVSGGGKSVFATMLIPYHMQIGNVVSVMDYEGDQYTFFADYIRASNPEHVRVFSMGSQSQSYFDPVAIPKRTGDINIDATLKATAITFATSIFRVIISGVNSTLSNNESEIVSKGIKRVYLSAGVTDDPDTWEKSSNLRLSDIYEEIKFMVETRELKNEVDVEESLHSDAVNIVNACREYFDIEGMTSPIFQKPISSEEINKAKLIVFSFGMKGAPESVHGSKELALKQLSVACVLNQISNHCKYVRKCFHVNIFEECQRWFSIKGSAEIIINKVTGGRKRADIIFMLTNSINDLMDDSSKYMMKLKQNINNIAIGATLDNEVRRKVYKAFDMNECQGVLEKITDAYLAMRYKGNEGKGGSVVRRDLGENPYGFSFLLKLDTGKKAVCKAQVTEKYLKSKIFSSGT